MSVTTLPVASAPVPSAPPSMMPTTFDGAMQLANMMAKGKLVPNHLQGSPADCLLVIEQAARWGMSPFAVAQATSVISGKLMFEGKLVAAAIHGSGVLAGRLSHDFEGQGETLTVRVSGVLRGETKPREVKLVLKDAKTSNQMWTKQPEQQLVYAGTRVWARRHVPEVMLGVYSPEEMETAPVRVSDDHGGPTIEHEPPPAPAAPAAPGGPSFGNRADRVIRTIDTADTLDRLARIRTHAQPLIDELDEAGRPELRERLFDAFSAARARLGAPSHD